ncbi:hypothetical protein SDC9_124516 [bioreactor metagenome]|uniref:Uncharacterized protein n=1 Tax=bioreactor metagenome TaxID=1076179 RepID=A0A645CKK6_9ZZZZ
MHGLRIVVLPNGRLFLKNDLAGIYFVLEKECGHARLLFAVDDGPVDGSCSPVLGQQRGVQVERAKGRHGPNGLGQHAESYNHLDIRFQAPQLVQKNFVFQVFGL